MPAIAAVLGIVIGVIIVWVFTFDPSECMSLERHTNPGVRFLVWLWNWCIFN